jgi:hypothetical protein
MKVILAGIMAVILSGCAINAPELVLSTKQYPIDVGRLSVSNLSTDNEQVYINSDGFLKLPNVATKPTFVNYVFESLKQKLTSASTGGSEVLEVMLLRAELLTETKAADSITFIGFFTILSDRDHVCSVDVIFKYGLINERKKFESKKMLNRSWGDIDIEVKKEIVESCVEKIVYDVASFANSFVKKK